MSDASRRGWFALAAVLLAGALGVVLAVAAELAVRWRERHRSRPTDMMTTLYYRHARLQQGIVRNYDYFGWVQTDSLGLRVATPLASAAPETLRILADGGSTTFDVGVSAGDSTWPARLGRLLSDSSRRVEVLNAGVPGYTVLDNLVRFEQELHRLRPQVVLLLQGHNDLYIILHPPAVPDPDAPQELEPVTPWQRWLERHSLLYGKTLAAWRRMTGRIGASPRLRPADETRALLDRGLTQFEADVRAYVAVVHALGARVVLIAPPIVAGTATAVQGEAADRLWAAFGDVEPAVVLEGYAREREILQRVAGELGASFLPTADFGLDNPSVYESGDPMHFNDRGAAMMADRLAAAMRRMPSPLASTAGQ